MSSLHSKIFLTVLSFSSAILMVIFSVRIFGDRSDHLSPKIHSPSTLQIVPPEQLESPSPLLRSKPGIDLRGNHSLKPPGEVLSEKMLDPRNDPILWEEVREDLALIIKDKFPELILSQRDLQRLTETIRTLQKSMHELGELERTTTNRAEIQKIRSQLNRTLETFEEITEMSLSDFILFGRPESGIDNEKPDSEEIVEEYLSDVRS